jgi:hypothetical protein
MPHAPNEIQGYLNKRALDLFIFESTIPFTLDAFCSSHFTIYVELNVRLLHHTIHAHFYYLYPTHW